MNGARNRKDGGCPHGLSDSVTAVVAIAPQRGRVSASTAGANLSSAGGTVSLSAARSQFEATNIIDMKGTEDITYDSKHSHSRNYLGGLKAEINPNHIKYFKALSIA